MPRRREVPKREVLPDPKFGNQDVLDHAWAPANDVVETQQDIEAS